MTLFSKNRQDKPGFLTRLARDKAGNTLMLMAAALIPLLGLVGGGVDLARMYMTKTRMQHACDAGALAGRKEMGGGTWGQDGGAPGKSAMQFFDANFADGAYGSSKYGSGDKLVTFTETGGKVVGNASVEVPMTIMQVFDFDKDTIAVTCDADMRLPNTDVMFVLDTTGSMNDKLPGDPQRKIDGLHNAVKCFYEIVAKLATDGNCGPTKPSGGTSDQVQIRFGFVPYASNVNVGTDASIVNSGWFASTWNYRSRERNKTTPTQWSGVWTTYSTIASTKTGKCAAAPANADLVQYRVNKTQVGTIYSCVYDKQTGVPLWDYGLKSKDISKLKNGTGFNTSVTSPINDDGTAKTITWDGCVEERSNDYDPSVSEQAKIDKTPDPKVASSLWGPMLTGMIYSPKGLYKDSAWYDADISADSNNYPGVQDKNVSYGCPQKSMKLRAWPSASAFDAYVDSLTPNGTTHHDIGILWGARLMSPTGIFKAENAKTPAGGDIQRNVIFMTDGIGNSNPNDYSAYGVPWFDHRQISAEDSKLHDPLTNQVETRMLSVCNAIKNMKDTSIWVISFGTPADIDPDTETKLKQCAQGDNGHYYSATDSTTLLAAFQSIANQISQLRLIK